MMQNMIERTLEALRVERIYLLGLAYGKAFINPSSPSKEEKDENRPRSI